MDTLNSKERSALMAKIRSKDTKPEIFIRKALWKLNYRYRLHSKKLPGSPDLVFARRKKVIFINGCFWHGHDCRKGKLPKTRTDFWAQKINRNRARDESVITKLEAMGWKTFTVWECKVKEADIISRITTFLNES